jgi:hypothetical protein
MKSNSKYYKANFILHLIYGCICWCCVLYGLAHANYGGFIGSGGGRWSDLTDWLSIIFFVPAPLITNILCIRMCYRNTKLIREFFKCIGIALFGGYLSGFIVVAIGRLLGY